MAIEFEILYKDQTPPGGWDYQQPESGRRFNGYAYTNWLDQIRTHRIQNGYSLSADFEAEVVDQLVKRHPEWVKLGIARRIGQPSKTRKFSLSATVAFFTMLYKWIKSGSPMVSQEEAEGRASICSTCPYNVKLSYGCGPCFSIVMSWIAKVVGNRTTTKDSLLDNCGICSCNLRAAVHFPIEAQTENLSEEIKNDLMSVEYCWKGKGLRDL